MLEDAIREVRVRVRTDLSSDAAEIRPAVERVVRAALERCAGVLEERAPGRVVLIARLPLRWRFDELDELALGEPEHIEELARSAADVIEQLALPVAGGASLSSGSSVPDVMFFDDEAHLLASQLLALAHGRREWFDAMTRMADDRDPWVALTRPEHRVLAEATLRRLAGEGALARVLAAGDTAGVAALTAVLGIEPVSAIGSIGERTIAPRGGGLATELARAASGWPVLARPARHLALLVHAAVLLDRKLDAGDVAALAAAVESVSAPADARTADESTPDRAHARQRERPAEERLPEEEAGRTVVTGCAGLFYLLDRLQELDLPESLWKACLPEGTVLAAAAAALLGPEFESDPAPALLGGIERVVPCPEITHEQHVEVARATCAQMAAALPRRGGAGIPGAVVTLADRASGRVLIAAVEGVPFTFFAWPAQTPDLVREGLATLLDLWPSSAPLTAAPALITLDASGRLRPWLHAPVARCLVPEASSAPASALLAMVAGAPATLLAWRAGDAASDGAAAFVARRLARSARVRVTSDRMDVILSGAAIDLDFRRAALDVDPGWLPWLRRSVRFVFEGLEVLEEP
jgi:hypothetical protein